MPTKPNRAGNQQNYVPAGNGDASGEYGDNATGSNIHFKVFKKPDGIQIENKGSEKYKYFLNEINAFAKGNAEINDYDEFIEKLNDAWAFKELTNEELGELYNLLDKAKEEYDKLPNSNKQDYDNFYKGEGKDKLIFQLSAKLSKNGKLTPNGQKLLENIKDADDELSGVISDYWRNNPKTDLKLGKNYNACYKTTIYGYGLGGYKEKSVILGGESLGYDDGNYSKGGVFFHESGHALNDTFSYGKWSENYKSQKYDKTLADMIKEEITQNVDFEKLKEEFTKMREEYKTEEFDKLLAERDSLYDKASEMTKSVYENPKVKEYDAELSKIKDEMHLGYINGRYNELSSLREKYYEKSKERDDFRNSLYPTEYSTIVNRKKELSNKLQEMQNQAYHKSNVYYGDISDMCQASLGKKLGMGHDRNYFYQDRTNRGDEAFAEIMSAKATNPKSLGILQKYIPKSLEIFDEIMRKIKGEK